ncbi:MAG TPA: (Fe-S)-binding protein [Nitrospirota bacterium]|nr:(Fe-S)-binding protein [Nitrospirota bacterium]
MKRVLHDTAPCSPLRERYGKEISRCVKCGSCRAVCPPSIAERSESLSARGRMALIKAVIEGRLPFSSRVKDRLASCTSCLACEAACPSNVPVTEIIGAAKEEAVRESGHGVVNQIVASSLKSDVAMRFLAWLAPFVLHYPGGSIQGKGLGPGRGWRPGSEFVANEKARGRVALFPGCAISHFQQDIGRSAITVLSAIGYEVIVPEGLKCCGRPLLSLGDRKNAEELALYNSTLLSRLEVDAVVTACASCGLTFKREYPKLLPPGMKTPRMHDIHEVMHRGLSGKALGAVQKTVTFHDPCHLGRGQGLSGAAREVLRSLPGLMLVEMKNADRCCGFGGVMRITHGGLSNAIAADKAAMIMQTGASAVVTGCPGCRMQITEALRRAGSHIEVVHTVQIVEETLTRAERRARAAG